MRHEDFAEFRKSGDFEINPQSPLARDAALLGLGRGRKSLTFRDESPYRNHGALTGMNPATGWVWDAELGRFALNLVYTGTYGQCVVLGNVLPLIGTNITVSAWIKTAADTLALIASKNLSGWWFSTGASPSRSLAWYSGSNYALSATNAFGNDVWSHVAARFLTANHSIEFFSNGVSWGAPSTAPGVVGSNATSVVIGEDSRDLLGYPFIGRMADVCIHARALSASEIAALADRSNVDLSLGGVPLILPPRRRIFKAAAVPPAGAIMNQMQSANLGADLFDGSILAA